MAASSSNGSNAATAYAVNSSSMLSLLSEVNKHADGHRRGSSQKASSSASTTSKSRAAKKNKGSLFDRSNRGLEARSARDRSHMLSREDMSVEARRVLESREKMEKKAALYEKLAKGEGLAGASREQLREGLLVDFETKAIEESYKDRSSEESDSDSDGVDDAQAGPQSKPKIEDDDPLVETTDELGRTRWVRASQLAKEAASAPRASVIDDGALPYYSNDISLASQSLPSQNNNTYYGDQREFHVYEPTAEELAERRKKLDLDAPLNAHFDGTKEVRARGAGFIQLSRDEETRKKQMEELLSERKETEQKREQIDKEGDAQTRRNKELEERKKLVEEKKRQVLEKRKAAEAAREEAAKRSKAT